MFHLRVKRKKPFHAELRRFHLLKCVCCCLTLTPPSLLLPELVQDSQIFQKLPLLLLACLRIPLEMLVFALPSSSRYPPFLERKKHHFLSGIPLLLQEKILLVAVPIPHSLPPVDLYCCEGEEVENCCLPNCYYYIYLSDALWSL